MSIRNFFQIRTTWKNWELGIFKLCMVAAGIVAGTLFYRTFADYILILVVIFIITAGYLFIRWFGQLIFKIKEPVQSSA